MQFTYKLFMTNLFAKMHILGRIKATTDLNKLNTKLGGLPGMSL